MKRLKVALLLVCTLVLSLVAFAGCNKPCDHDNITEITVDASSVVKTYNVGDTFSLSGLKLTAHCGDCKKDIEITEFGDVVITYKNGNAFRYGDTKVTVSYGGQSYDITGITVNCVNHDVSGQPYVNDATSHWKECKICGAKIGTEAHDYQAQCDATDHWTECECGKIGEAKENHELSLAISGNYIKKYAIGNTISSNFMVASFVCDCGYETEGATEGITIAIKGKAENTTLIEEADVTDNELTIVVSYGGKACEITVSVVTPNVISNFNDVEVICGENITLAATALEDAEIKYYVKSTGDYAEFTNGSTLPAGTYTVKAVAQETENHIESSLEKKITVSHVAFEDFVGEWEFNEDYTQKVAKCGCGEVLATINVTASDEVDLGLSNNEGTLVSTLGDWFAIDLTKIGDVDLVSATVDGVDLTVSENKIAIADVIKLFGEKELSLVVETADGAQHDVTYNILFISKAIANYEDLTKINSIVRLLPVELGYKDNNGNALGIFGGYFKLTADIENTDNARWLTPFLLNDAKTLVTSDVFCGTLDGDGHYVDGFVLNYHDWNSAESKNVVVPLTYNNRYSLIGANLGFGGTVKNIAFTNVTAQTKSTLFAEGAVFASNKPEENKVPIIANYENIYVSYKTVGWLNGTSKQIEGNSFTSVFGYANSCNAQLNVKNAIIDLNHVEFPYEEAKQSFVVLGGFYNDLYNCNFSNVYVVSAPAGIGLIASGNKWAGTTYYSVDGTYSYYDGGFKSGVRAGQNEELYQPSDTTYNFSNGYVLGNPELWADEAWVNSWSEDFWTVNKDVEGNLTGLPYYKTVTPIKDGIEITGVTDGEEISQGTSVTISTNRKAAILVLDLPEGLEEGDVTLNGNVLTIGKGLEQGTEFKVKAIYTFDFSITDEITIVIGYETKTVNFNYGKELDLNVFDKEGTLTVEDADATLDLTKTYVDENNYLDIELAEGITKLTIDGNVIDGAKLEGKAIKFKKNLIPVTCSGEVELVFEGFYDDTVYFFKTTILVVTAKISTEAELLGLIDFYAKMPNNGGYYVLTSDITCAGNKSFGKDIVASGSTYSGTFLGSSAKPFNGTIDGQGHVIDNMLCSNNVSSGNAFINYMGANAELKNIAFTNFKFGAYGGVVGYAFAGSKISNVYVDVASYGANSAGGNSTWTWGVCALFGSFDYLNKSILDLDNVVVDFTKTQAYLATRAALSGYDVFFAKANVASTFNNVIVTGLITTIAGESVKNRVIREFTSGNITNGAGYGIYATYSDGTTNGIDLPDTNWDENYWLSVEGAVPVFKTLFDAKTAIAFDGIADGDDLYLGNSVTLKANRNDAIFSLGDEYAGITLAGNVLTIGEGAVEGTITVTATCAYDTKNTVSITLNIHPVSLVTLTNVQLVDLQLTAKDGVVSSGDAKVSIDLSEIKEDVGDNASVYFDGAKLQDGITVSDKIVKFNANTITNKEAIGAHTLTVVTSLYCITVPVDVITKGLTNAEDLKNFTQVAAILRNGDNSKGTVGYYKVLNDIDFTGYTLVKADIKNFADGYNERFNGTFDGDGHIISNLKIVDPAGSWAFFGYIGEKGIIKNVAFTDMIVKQNIAFNLGGYAGAKVEDCYFSYKIFGANDDGSALADYPNPAGMFLTNGDGNMAFKNVVFDLGAAGTALQQRNYLNTNYGKYFGSIKNATFNNVALLNVPVCVKGVTDDNGGTYVPISIRVGYTTAGTTRYYNAEEIAAKGLYVSFTDNTDNGVTLPDSGFNADIWNLEKGSIPTFKGVVSQISLTAVQEVDLQLSVKDGVATSGDAKVSISLEAISGSVGDKASVSLDGTLLQSDIDIADKIVKFNANTIDKSITGEHTLTILTSKYKITIPAFVITKGIYTPDDLRSIGAIDAFITVAGKDKNCRYGYYKLMQNIDFASEEGNSGAYRASINDKLEPINVLSLTEFGKVNQIGDNNKYFAGTFDGNGFAIKNMSMVDNKYDTTWKVTAGNEYYFFGQINGGATIKNLAFVDLVLGEKSSIYKISYYGKFTNIYIGIKIMGSNNDYTGAHSRDLNDSGLFGTYSNSDSSANTYTNVVVDYTNTVGIANIRSLNTNSGQVFGIINAKDKFNNVMFVGIPTAFDNFFATKTRSGGGTISARFTLTDVAAKGIYVEHSDKTNNGATINNTWDKAFWDYTVGQTPSFKLKSNPGEAQAVALKAVQNVDLCLFNDSGKLSSGDANVTLSLAEIEGDVGTTAKVYLGENLLVTNIAVSDKKVTFKANLIDSMIYGAQTFRVVTESYDVTIPALVISKGIKTYDDLKSMASVSKLIKTDFKTDKGDFHKRDGSNYVHNAFGGYFMLMNDIENTANENWTQWISTGYDEAFIGTIDGNGHTIKGYRYVEYENFASLVGCFLAGTVKDINFTEVTLKNKGSVIVFGGNGYQATFQGYIENVNVSYKEISASDNANTLATFVRGGGQIYLKDCMVDLTNATFNDKHGFVAIGIPYDINTYCEGAYVIGLKPKMSLVSVWINTQEYFTYEGKNTWVNYKIASGVWTDMAGESNGKDFVNGIIGAYETEQDFLDAYRSDTKFSINIDLTGGKRVLVTSKTGVRSEVDTWDKDCWYYNEGQMPIFKSAFVPSETINLTQTQNFSLDLKEESGAIVRSNNDSEFIIDLSDSSLTGKLGAKADVYIGDKKIAAAVNISDNSIKLKKNLVDVRTFGATSVTVVTKIGTSRYDIVVPFVIASMEIDSPESLASVSKLAKLLGNGTNVYDGYFVLKSDITYSGTWAGIAPNATFAGTIDGANYKISGITVKSDDNTGFIGDTFKGELINITLDIAVKAKTSALALNGDGATIKNVILNTSFANAASNEYFGGMFKTSMNNCVVEDVTVVLGGTKPAMGKAKFLALGVVSPADGELNSTFKNVVVVDSGSWTTPAGGFALFATYKTTMATYYSTGACKSESSYPNFNLTGVSVVDSLK